MHELLQPLSVTSGMCTRLIHFQDCYSFLRISYCRTTNITELPSAQSFLEVTKQFFLSQLGTMNIIHFIFQMASFIIIFVMPIIMLFLYLHFSQFCIVSFSNLVFLCILTSWVDSGPQVCRH